MSSYRGPINHVQSSIHRATNRHTCSSSTSPTLLTRPFLQLPSQDQYADPNLFANLLLNREQVYSDRSVTSPDTKPVRQDLRYGGTQYSDPSLQFAETDTKPYIPPEDLDVDLLLDELLSMAPPVKVARKRRQPARQAKRKLPSPKIKSRTPTTSPTTNYEKRQKTEAGHSRKLQSEESSQSDSDDTVVKMGPPAHVGVIEISDSENEEAKPSLRHSIAARVGQRSPKACDHIQELQQLRVLLATAKAETVAAKAAAETVTAEMEATRILLRTKDEQIKALEARNDEQATELGSFKATLEALRADLRDVTQERDHLQTRSEEQRSLISDHTLVITELKDTQSELQALQQKFNTAETQHTEALQTMTEKLSKADAATQSPPSSQGTHTSPSSFFSTSRHLSKPATPPATPTFAPPLDPRAAPSASPFRSIGPVDEQKNEGIRRTYVKIKRKYDILHSVLKSLETCTRSMDLSSFGEFGRCMRLVRSALEEDGMEQ
ncbi:hypothetical protein J1614_002169 [Plenodomus biglobosus]|nr:hypothetical protein J1614_002169 [Plenodomus biglobosus]